MGRRFRATRGELEVNLAAEEKVFLTGLLEVLATVSQGGNDRAAQRLHVPVYLDDPEANEEWWRLMGEELSAARRADRHVFERVMTEQGRVRLSAQDAGSLLKVLNEGRLALGARFGVEVEADHEELPEEQREVMDYLAWLLDDLTTELTRLL
jgi:hypothetical protein